MTTTATKVSGMAAPQKHVPDPQTPNGQWALWLRHLLEERDKTPDDLASGIGMSRALIYRWLAGKSVPAIAIWADIATFLTLDDWRALTPTCEHLESIGARKRTKRRK